MKTFIALVIVATLFAVSNSAPQLGGGGGGIPIVGDLLGGLPIVGGLLNGNGGGLLNVEQSAESLEKKTPMKSNVPQKNLTDGECTTTLSKALGLKLCADVKIPPSIS